MLRLNQLSDYADHSRFTGPCAAARSNAVGEAKCAVCQRDDLRKSVHVLREVAVADLLKS